MFWKFSQTQGFWWFYYGIPHSKITKSLEIWGKSQNIFSSEEKIFILKKVFDENCFTSKFRFGRLIPAILVDQKFIILQGLHILGKIQVVTLPSANYPNNRLHITFVFFNIFTTFFVCDTEEIMCVKKHLWFLWFCASYMHEIRDTRIFRNFS